MSKYYVHNGQLYSTSELKHWKYVKRERVNGRWRYYYDDKEYQAAKNAKDKAQKDYNEVSEASAYLNREIETTAKKAESDGKVTFDEQLNVNLLASTLSAVDAAKVEAGKEFVKKNEEFKKISTKTLPRRIIATGIAKVANWFEKLKSKFR